MERAIEAWNADDWEAMKALSDPEVVTVAPQGRPEPGTSYGWEAVRRQFERLKASWADERLQAASARQRYDQLAEAG